MAWEETVLTQNHDELLEEGEWVWADSAYPVLVQYSMAIVSTS